MSIRHDLECLIHHSYQETWSTFDWVRSNARTYGLTQRKVDKWKTPGEPAFVSNLLEYPTTRQRLYDVLKKHPEFTAFHSVPPVISGVFIHQKPKVKLRGRQGPIELGDLLLVRQHFQTGVAVPQGRAFLVQAKSSDSPRVTSLTGNEEKQFSLYSDWTTQFTFPNQEFGPTPDGSRYWNFSSGPQPYSDTGVYGIVSNTRKVPRSFPNDCPWAIGFASLPPAAEPRSVDASKLSMAEALEGFLLGTWGRPWDASLPTSDHWSWFVVECLRAAAEWRPYPAQRIGVIKVPRARRRDVVGIVEMMAAASTFVPGPYWPLTSLLTDLGPDLTASNARALTSTWRGTVGERHEDGGGDEPPLDAQLGTLQPMARGLSVLYIATTGSGRLGDPPDQPDPLNNPPHKDFGTW